MSTALTGVRLITMALNVPGPLAAAHVAGHGASVTKIEPPSGDPLAAMSPAWYRELHEKVDVKRVDLKSEAGKSEFRTLIADAGVFLSSQRPSALARLGIDAKSMAHTRWVNIVGECARPEVAGHDVTYQARAGLLRDRLPVTLVADIMGSERAFAAMLLLLRGPVGTHEEIGLYDSVAPLTAPLRHGITRDGGRLGGAIPEYGVYRAREGYVAVSALEPHFRARMYELLKLAPGSALDEIMRTRTAEEWERWGEDNDVPIARVASF